MSRRFGLLARLVPVVLVALLAVPSLSGAGKWRVRKDAAPIYYQMQITTFTRRGEKKVVLEVDVQATEQKDDKGNPLFKVRTTQEHLVQGREIKGQQMAFGAMSMAWAAGGMQWMMYQRLFTQLDLVVGEKMSFFGGMLAKVEGQEKIAGYDGFVVKVYNTTKDEPVLQAELVLHPDVPIALRARSYARKGNLTTENLLLKVDLRTAAASTENR